MLLLDNIRGTPEKGQISTVNTVTLIIARSKKNTNENPIEQEKEKASKSLFKVFKPNSNGVK